MPISSLHHVSLNVTDLDAAIAFYTGPMGMSINPDRPELNDPGAWLAAGTAEIHLIVNPVPDPLGQHFALAVDDLDATVADLRSQGIEVRGPAPTGVDGPPQAFITDPDGNWIELREP